MIPDEAVEAAMNHLTLDAEPYIGRHEMRAILEAAAPYLMGTAWDEGREHGVTYPYVERTIATEANPYKEASK